MSEIDSSTHVVMIADDCTDDESKSNDSGKLTLTFHPDETDPIDKEKMQRIWKYIESRQDFKDLMVTFRTAKTKKATAKKSQACEKDSSQEASKVMDMQEENLKKIPHTAIEIFGEFQGLPNTVKGCMEKFQKRKADCWHCPSAENFQASRNDDVLSEINHYQQNLVTQVIGERSEKHVYKLNYGKK